MGQKSNLLTLKKVNKNLNLVSYETKTFLYSLQYLKYFETLLAKKNIWLIRKTLVLSSSSVFLALDVFYKSVKTTFYKKKGLSTVKKPLLFSSNQSLIRLFQKNFPLNKINAVTCTINNLNRHLNSTLLSFLYNRTKKFSTNIFVRRFNLYIDFLKLTALLIQNKLSSKNYIHLLSQVFKSLSKRVHTRFLFFLKAIFKLIIEISLPSAINTIKGFKFVINGKLQGKTRASFSCIQEGSVPTQSISKNIDFAKSHVYTLYGVFGMRMWIYRKD